MDQLNVNSLWRGRDIVKNKSQEQDTVNNFKDDKPEYPWSRLGAMCGSQNHHPTESVNQWIKVSINLQSFQPCYTILNIETLLAQLECECYKHTPTVLKSHFSVFVSVDCDCWFYWSFKFSTNSSEPNPIAQSQKQNGQTPGVCSSQWWCQECEDIVVSGSGFPFCFFFNISLNTKDKTTNNTEWDTQCCLHNFSIWLGC